MTAKQQKDIDLTLALTLQMQSVIHTIDDLSNEVIYKQEFKNRCNNFYNWLEKHVEPMTAELPAETVNDWVNIVNKFDEIVKNIHLFESKE